MIELPRPCFSPACRGEVRRQAIACEQHPESVDCSGTCAERLAGRESRCCFCGEANAAEPPAVPPFPMQRPLPVEVAPATKKEGGRPPRPRRPGSLLPHEIEVAERAPEADAKQERRGEAKRSGRRVGRPGRRPRKGGGRQRESD